MARKKKKIKKKINKIKKNKGKAADKKLTAQNLKKRVLTLIGQQNRA